MFGDKDKDRFRVKNGETFVYFDDFIKEKFAQIKGEELKIAGDIEKYVIENDGERVHLWVH